MNTNLCLLLLAFCGGGSSLKAQPAFPTALPAMATNSNATDTCPHLQFSGSLTGKESARLFWRCSQAMDVLYFELEQRTDSLHFEPVLLMQAKGMTRNAAGYTYISPSHLPGVQHYRLRVVERNGKETNLSLMLPAIATEALATN